MRYDPERAASVKHETSCVMVRTILMASVLAVLLAAPVGSQQPGFIGLYAEQTWEGCLMFDETPGVRTVYVYHHLGQGRGVRFRVVAGPGVTMTYLSETHYYPTLGDTQNGITVCYQQCIGGPLVATIQYMAYGTSSINTRINVVPHPETNAVEVMNCDGTISGVPVQPLSVNPEGGCLPPVWYGQPTSPQDFCQALPVQKTTWGSIKALYE